jgi:glucan biosynthesis protein
MIKLDISGNEARVEVRKNDEDRAFIVQFVGSDITEIQSVIVIEVDYDNRILSTEVESSRFTPGYSNEFNFEFGEDDSKVKIIAIWDKVGNKDYKFIFIN